MKAPKLTCVLLAAVLSATAFGAQIDPAFAEIAAPINCFTITPDGSILVGGHAGAAQLRTDGSVLASFTTDGPVNAAATPPTGPFFGGRFSQFDGAAAANLSSASGNLPGTSGSVDVLAVDSQGRILFGGSFRMAGGHSAVYIARLTDAHAIDPSFVSSLRPTFAIEAGVTAIATADDDKILVGGIFETAGGFSYLSRLNGDGSLDRSFALADNSILYTKTIIPLPNGKVLIGGQSKAGSGFAKRLNADGSLDPSFEAQAFDAPVLSLAIDSLGRILVAGKGVHRLLSDGPVDASWSFHTDNIIQAIGVDANGRILIGGSAGFQRLIDGPVQNPFATNKKVFRGALQIEAGENYLIESSTDLHHWSSLSSGSSNSSSLEVVDEAVATRTKRFFRARRQ